MKRRQRGTDTFNLSFLDAITCGFGAVILLLVLVKFNEPTTIERSTQEVEAMLARLQQELFEIRGETAVLNREMKTVTEQLSDSRELLARLRGDFSELSGRYAATRDDAEMDSSERGELEAARQSLTEEMRRLLADYTPPEQERTVGGVPVDSEYIVFVIDTSGSMFNGAWRAVLRKVQEALAVYPRVKGIQVMNDMGNYMFSSYAGRWMPDSPEMRRRIVETLRNWSPYSNSTPVEGITEAINTFYEPDKPMSIYIFGDDFARGGSIEAVARYVENINRANDSGRQLVRIHAVGFPTQMGGGYRENFFQFANLMRTLCERNGGSFVALTTL